MPRAVMCQKYLTFRERNTGTLTQQDVVVVRKSQPERSREQRGRFLWRRIDKHGKANIIGRIQRRARFQTVLFLDC